VVRSSRVAVAAKLGRALPLLELPIMDVAFTSEIWLLSYTLARKQKRVLRRRPAS
jgi:hypothetical protein